MRRLFLLFLLFTLLPNSAYAFGSIYCGQDAKGKYACTVQTRNPSEVGAKELARVTCGMQLKNCIPIGPTDTFQNICKSVASPSDGSRWYSALGASFNEAVANATNSCQSQNATCVTLVTACDFLSATPTSTAQQPVNPERIRIFSNPVDAIESGLAFGLAAIIVLIAFAKRSALINFIIHDRLPLKLPVYGEDIQSLFKRTQRVNWYGRVIFGIVANLSMTHQQLSDIRKYWLGRVVAFDSLRRQRQNELARMHLQLAAAAKPQLKQPTALRQLWASIKYVFYIIFYLIRALFSFLFGFLFIRVTIAKLARGTHIESKDLVLVLEAKEAIEASAKYLKEYLETANTFDGRDEVTDA